MSETATPEFSRRVVAAGLPDRESTMALEATETECADLARRYGVLAVSAVSASVRLTPIAKRCVRMEADYQARLVQECVVTLEPVETRVEGGFERIFSPDVVEDELSDAVELDEEAAEPADPIVDGVIDVGEAVAEQIALEIDPFPRAPGAELAVLESAQDGENEEDARPHPFAGLAVLKDKLERGN